MRHLASLISIFLFIACNANAIPPDQSNEWRTARSRATEQQKASTDTLVQFLLTAAAADFHAHHPSRTIHFRKVRVGHVTTPDEGTEYMLCDQSARARNKSDWVPFVTIKTSGYEQYLGDQAASFCKRPSILRERRDLSPLLQSRFDSLQ